MNIAYKLHNGSPGGIIRRVSHGQSHKAIELIQKQQRALGKKDGITWKTVEGDMIDALVASTKL